MGQVGSGAKEIAKDAIAHDESRIREDVQRRRAFDPTFHLSVRLVPGFWTTRRLPADATEEEAIAIAEAEAKWVRRTDPGPSACLDIHSCHRDKNDQVQEPIDSQPRAAKRSSKTYANISAETPGVAISNANGRQAGWRWVWSPQVHEPKVITYEGLIAAVAIPGYINKSEKLWIIAFG